VGKGRSEMLWKCKNSGRFGLISRDCKNPRRGRFFGFYGEIFLTATMVAKQGSTEVTKFGKEGP